jgi:hypothetical protein
LADFTLDAGSSTLTVQLSDNADGYLIADAVRIVRLGPLQAAGGALSDSSAAAIDTTQADQMLAAAVARWSASGLDATSVAAMSQADAVVTDLPGSLLGATDVGGQTIWVDADAAGYGWFVDTTPLVDEEFTPADDGTLQANPAGAAAGQMDLLSVLAHELGHLLGLGDLDSDASAGDLMAETLPVGVRRVPAGAASQVAPMLASSAAVPSVAAAVSAQAPAEAAAVVPEGSTVNRTEEAADARQLLFADVEELVGGPQTDLDDLLAAGDLLANDSAPVDQLFGDLS